MIRSKALAVCAMLGRVSTVLLGVVGVSAIGWMNGHGLYLLFLLMAAAGSQAAFTMPGSKQQPKTNSL